MEAEAGGDNFGWLHDTFFEDGFPWQEIDDIYSEKLKFCTGFFKEHFRFYDAIF